MTTDRRRLAGAAARDDSGLSIIEIIAAIMIFMVISVGVAQGLVTVIRLAGDQQHRITALSLASSDVDLVRGQQSVFDIANATYDQTVDGIVYTVERSVEWVDANGNDVSCGTGTGAKLRVLRVNVDVTWGGQVKPISPVNFDTVVAPDGSLHDEDLAVLMISVRGADGNGVAGIPVTLTATSGLASGSTVPTPTTTNADGCSYAIGVPPANYTVSIAKAGYVSGDQLESPVSKSLTIAAGNTISTNFVFDNAAIFPVTYVAPNGATPSGTYRYPASIDYTASNSRGDKAVARNGSASLKLFPWLDGYSIVYGTYIAQSIDGAADPALDAKDGCQSTNPATWGAQTIGSDDLVAGQPGIAVAAAGQTSPTVALPVGFVKVRLDSGYSNRTVVATTTTPANGDPGCGTGLSYSFANVNDGDIIVLPFGTWQISSTGTNRVKKAEVQSNAGSYPMTADRIVTLDPRAKVN
jgi:hypothetical protein